MNNERMEILKMIAEQTITPEEGERLLRALDESGERGNRETGEPPPGMKFSKSMTLDELGEMIRKSVSNGLKAAQESIGEAVAIARSEFGFEEEETGEHREIEESDVLIPLQDAVELEVKVNPVRGGPCMLRIERGDEDGIRVRREGRGHASVKRTEDRLTLQLGKHDTCLLVPNGIRTVRFSNMGGSVRVIGLSAAIRGKVMGGDIRLDAVPGDCSLRVAGGKIESRLGPAWTGRLELSVDGGKIDLHLPAGLRDRGVATRLKALCVGGRISLDPALGVTRTVSHPGESRVDVVIGKPSREEPGNLISLRTAGGKIQVTADES